MKKKKRKLKKPVKLFLFGVCSTILLIIGIFFAIDQYEIHQLKEIGYEEIKAIDKYKLRKTLIKRGEYSKALEDALVEGVVYLDYLDLYFVRDEVSLEITLLYQKLEDKAYPKESLLALFSELDFRELTPLLVFDFQEEITLYINDVISNRHKNQNQFVLTNSYFSHYEQVAITTITDPHAIFVSKRYQLPQDYAVDVVNVSIGCRLSLMQLEVTTAQAYETMCNDMKDLGMQIASTSGYRTHETQESIYNSVIADYGLERGEMRAVRPGFSEHQTGLAVDIASLTTPDVYFVDSMESDWLIEHAHEYGFILRYPQGYEQITGVQYESWHYRYVGIELATKIKESGLTYDEYYLLYLK